MKQAVLSHSGGMDSSALLIRLLFEGYKVTSLSFNYGQKHSIELKKAYDLRGYLYQKGWQVYGYDIDLSDLQPLLKSNLVKGGEEVPEGHYENENMIQTVVPNRNKIFSSILQSVALSIDQTRKDRYTETVIALGIHAGDHAIYPDCRQEFRDADYLAFLKGNYDAHDIQYYTPFLKWDKFNILEDALDNCADMKLDFDEVFKRTNTSYKPIGQYSDYKSASSVERIEAFIKLGRPDPITYADENGVQSWDHVRKYVKNILENA